ncbi:MAG TPA: HD domain-containing protein [Anaerolineae bacterium]|nr:HD domain-containing protein [Anaerolineae bacterium]
MNREEAIALLDKHCSADASWHAHCVQVSAAARHLAELISQRGYPIDVDKAEVLGLLHDLGRSREHTLRHGIEGYLLTRAEGYEEEGRICLLHILKGRTLDQAVRLGMLTREEEVQLEREGWSSSEPSLEEKTATLADALMSDTGLVPIEQKYANARRRYGGQPHHHEDEAWVKGIGEEIAQMLGRAPYDALQELRDDLL